MNKQAFRQKYAALRDTAPVQRRADWSKQICFALQSLPVFKQASVIAGFYPIKSEVNLIPLLAQTLAEGKVLLLPRCRADGTLVFHRVKRLSDLVPGTYGIPEPSVHSPVVEPALIDLILVPGLAFDRGGFRIGYGKGYYDRLLPLLRGDCITCGVAFSLQLADCVPLEPFDLPVQLLVSERGVEKFFNQKDVNP